jgi:hypothetical protein
LSTCRLSGPKRIVIILAIFIQPIVERLTHYLTLRTGFNGTFIIFGIVAFVRIFVVYSRRLP